MRAAAVALAAAGFAAAAIPGHPLGLAVPLTAALAACAIGAAQVVAPTRHAVVFGAAALALATMPAFRDAGWIVAVDLVGTFALGSIAIAGSARASDVLAAPIAPLVRLLDVPTLAMAELGPRRVRRLAPAGNGVLLGIALVLPFGALFWTADGAFAELGSSVPLPEPSSWPGRAAVFALVLALTTGLALGARRPLSAAAIEPRRPLAPAEWAIPLALLDLLFLAFVLVQLTVLFGGNDHVLRTSGLTYAEYARHGFVQLLVAAALTLVVVATAARLAAGNRLLLRALLGVLCLLTLVVLASALRRLELYEDAFGFTRLRLAAHAIGLWLGGVFCLVLLAGLTRHARWLPRTLVGFSAAGLLAFSLANPDGLVASRNVDRWRATGKLDVDYVGSLSADAVPALVRLPSELRDRALARQRRQLARPEPWSSANVARRRAREALSRAAGRG